MKQVRTKTSRLLPTALLALLLAMALGVMGFLFAPARARADETPTEPETPTYTTAWRHNRSKPMQVVEGAELMFFNDNAVYVNPTNILEQPNKTAYFQLRVNKSTAWSAFMLLDKFDIEDAAWKGLSFNDTSATLDFDNHMRCIFQDGSGQHFTGHKATYDRDGKTTPNTTARAVKNPVASWSDSLVGVEIHVGEGGTDKTYIKVNGDTLIDEDNDNVWGNLTAATFAQGCFVAMHINLLSPMQAYIGEIGAPVITSLPSALKSALDMTKVHPVGEDDSKLQVKVKNLKDADTAVVKLNDTLLVKDTDYTVTKAEDVVTVQLKHNVFDAHAGANAHDLPRQSFITIEDADATVGKTSKAHIMLECQNNIPPSVANAYVETKTLEDGVSYEFTYASADGSVLKATDIEISSGVHADIINSTEKLVADTDYTITAGENNKYTLTFTKAYLRNVFANYYSRAFKVKIGEDTLLLNTRYIPAIKGWVTRTNDVTDEVVGDDYYTNIPLRRFQETTLSSRVYYSEAVDVTKPIFVEFNGLPETENVWVMFNVAKSLKQMDYFKDGVIAESALQAIFFTGRSDLQKLHGFAAGESTNANYNATNMTNNVIEVFFGNDSTDGYMKINGDEIGVLTTKQSDFPSGKAYIGWFNAHPANFNFKLNTHVNAIAIDSNDDSKYAMDLADAKDFTVKLCNYAKTDNIQLKSGDETLKAGDDYTFNAETGELTVKAAYFQRIMFSKEGVLSVWNDTAKTGTQFKLTYTSSKMKDSRIAFATKGNVSDATFAFPEGVTVSSVLDGNGDPLAQDKWAFANGTLTVRKEVIADNYGATEFIALAGSDLYPLYVYVQDFADGGCKISGNGTITAGNSAYLANGDVSYMFMQSYNLASGLTAKVDFKSVPGYYNAGRNYTKTGYVRFSFFDPYSGNTFVYTLYTNYPDDEVTATDTALYREYSMTDEAGNTVIAANSGAVNISRSENTSALGVHSVKFVAKNGGLEITVDNARAITVSGLGTFNLSASILTVTTPATQDDDAMTLGLQLYEEIKDIDYTAIDVTGNGNQPGGDNSSDNNGENNNGGSETKKKKCGGSASAAIPFAGLGLLALAASAVVAKRKKA